MHEIGSMLPAIKYHIHIYIFLTIVLLKVLVTGGLLALAIEKEII